MENEIIEDEIQAEPTLREELETAHAEASERADRARDEQGRFAAVKAEATDLPFKEKPATVVDEQKPVAEAVKPAEVVPDATEQPQRPTLAPNAWSHAAKAAFANADPVIKAEIARREADVHREFTKQDAERQMGREVQRLAAPYQQLLQSEGGNPTKAFQAYLETTRLLRQGDPQTKATLVRQMCQQFNIDLGQVQNAPEVDYSRQQEYSRAQQLEQENQRLQAQIQEIPLQSQINAFAADPAHEHYEAVKPVMAALLSGGQAQTLQEAYDQAVWARPDIRSNLMAQQTAQAEGKRVAEAKAKADAARRAAGSVIGSPGIGASVDPKAGNRSLRQELEAQMASSRI